MVRLIGYLFAVTQAFLTAIETPEWKCVDVVSEFVEQVLEEFMNSDKLQKLLTSKEHFDIVITEFFAGQEFILFFGHIFKAPVISLHAYRTNNVANGIFGNDLSLTYVPDVYTSFSDKMSLYERSLNSIYVLRGLYYVYYHKYLNKLERQFKKHFPFAPSLLDMTNNISLVFVNSHLTADYARPRVSNIIPVAVIHIEDTKELSGVSVV